MCSPTSDGGKIMQYCTFPTLTNLLAACCILASEDFVHAHGLENQAIEIIGQHLATDLPSTFEGKSAMELVGYSMTKDAADKAFAKAGFKEGEGRDQVGVVELHDCFASNEVSFRANHE